MWFLHLGTTIPRVWMTTSPLRDVSARSYIGLRIRVDVAVHRHRRADGGEPGLARACGLVTAAAPIGGGAY